MFDRGKDGHACRRLRTPEVSRDPAPGQVGQRGWQDLGADQCGLAAEIEERRGPLWIKLRKNRLLAEREPLQPR